ncbi:uncharacterized protein EV420DRAFT_1486209 [Desarmillaria tabescens]|uniref:Uncharacterized protein n=1 Tax=Armillaria tabescens TaxID=1929756 RepID=A0AA39MN96_ARMTA|nr:uncharacterized protein EV420DRAFT_1486209 [Desarmillaria tabescens]KAK0439685.1 hypothetical protein EV420DRAFT_1486209 [Desarmillaria tabescens]
MSQIDQVTAIQLSDSWFNAVIIESLAHGAMYIHGTSGSFTVADLHQTKVLVGISIFMYIMVTIHIAMRWYYARRAFITNGQTEETRFGGAGSYGEGIGGSSSFHPYAQSVGYVSHYDSEHNSNCSLFQVFDVFFLIQELTPFTGSQGDSATLWGSNSITWGVAYYSMTLSTTIICTVLIVYKLVQARTTSLSLSVPANPYHRVMEIMVESAVLYVVTLVVYILFIAMDNPYSLYPQVVLVSVTGKFSLNFRRALRRL